MSNFILRHTQLVTSGFFRRVKEIIAFLGCNAS